MRYKGKLHFTEGAPEEPQQLPGSFVAFTLNGEPQVRALKPCLHAPQLALPGSCLVPSLCRLHRESCCLLPSLRSIICQGMLKLQSCQMRLTRMRSYRAGGGAPRSVGRDVLPGCVALHKPHAAA